MQAPVGRVIARVILGTVTYGIFVETCTLKAGSLSRNAFYAPTNLTFTYGMHGNAASTLDASVDVLDNEYTTAGGTISTTEQFL